LAGAGEDAGGAAFGGCGNDQGVPEADLGFVFDAKGGGNLGRCGFCAPDGLGVHYHARGVFSQGRGDLACDVDVKFLEHFSDSALGACVCVMPGGMDSAQLKAAVKQGLWLGVRLPIRDRTRITPPSGARCSSI
jgi:hypothetical protein